MQKIPEFDFSRAHHLTKKEAHLFRQAFKNTFGYMPPSRNRRSNKKTRNKNLVLNLSPTILIWAKKMAKKYRVNVQTIIHETLLHQAMKAQQR